MARPRLSETVILAQQLRAPPAERWQCSAREPWIDRNTRESTDYLAAFATEDAARLYGRLQRYSARSVASGLIA